MSRNKSFFAPLARPDEKAPPVAIQGDGTDIFVICNGVKIAKRGHPGTPQAGGWISLEPGFAVVDINFPEAIEVRFEGVRLH